MWDELQSLPSNGIPWIFGGDFNVILSEDEKLGGLPFEQQEVVDFALFISSWSLMDLTFNGSIFTWWNGRIEEECIFKRLDRVLVNNESMGVFTSYEVHHLIRNGSDHASLQLTCNSDEMLGRKPYKFLNFWTKHKQFKDVVNQH